MLTLQHFTGNTKVGALHPPSSGETGNYIRIRIYVLKLQLGLPLPYTYRGHKARYHFDHTLAPMSNFSGRWLPTNQTPQIQLCMRDDGFRTLGRLCVSSGLPQCRRRLKHGIPISSNPHLSQIPLRRKRWRRETSATRSGRGCWQRPKLGILSSFSRPWLHCYGKLPLPEKMPTSCCTEAHCPPT